MAKVAKLTHTIFDIFDSKVWCSFEGLMVAWL